MAQINTVRVWNDNFLPYKENFKGEEIIIEPNHFILMDREKAIHFLGTMSPYTADGGGKQKPESYKKLRIELFKNTKELGDVSKYKCQACNFVANDVEDLDNHINEKHLTQLVDKEEIKKRMKNAS